MTVVGIIMNSSGAPAWLLVVLLTGKLLLPHSTALPEHLALSPSETQPPYSAASTALGILPVEHDGSNARSVYNESVASHQQRAQDVDHAVGLQGPLPSLTSARPDSPVAGSQGPLPMVHYNVTDSEINSVYSYNVNKSVEYLFEYSYNTSVLEHYALRVTVHSDLSTFSSPVMVVVRQKRGALSWQLPLPPPPNTQQLMDYHLVSRTVCPVQNFHVSAARSPAGTALQQQQEAVDNLSIERLSIDVSTQSEVDLPFTLSTKYFLNFDLKLDKGVYMAVSPSTPVFLQFNFPHQVDTVLVEVSSNNTLCAAVTVQNKTCPVWDEEATMRYANYYQTMSKQAAITLTREQFPDGFYVTIMTLSNDAQCADHRQHFDAKRSKRLVIQVKEKITHEEFLLGIGTGLLFCGVIYTVVAAKCCYDRRSDACTLRRLGPTPSCSPTLPRRRRRGRTASLGHHNRAMDPSPSITTSPSDTSVAAPAHSNTIGFASHSAYGASSQASQYASPAAPHVDTARATLPGAAGGGATEAAGPQNPACYGGAGSATVILSDEEGNRFDDLAELSRELDESMSALRRDNPTLATEIEELEVIHDSDSSMNADVEGFSDEDDDADSAEGLDTSCGDSRSRDNLSRDYYSSAGGREVDESGAEAQLGPGAVATKSYSSRDGAGRPRTVFVHHLFRKRARVLRRRSTRYITTLVSASIFYFVPVLQLVSTYQKVLDETGNQDICYYNFLCANPYGLLSDFNHVFSNSGYIGLGGLFVILTYRKQLRYNAEVKREPQVAQLGIPRDFGLYYAMSFALIMEGMLSASYHVCPNRSNFQFDTAFMYVIAVLLMMKLYQQRHPDITASADSVFIALACAVLLGVVGGLFGFTWFWIVSSIVHMFICILMSAYVYYLGRWSLISTMRTAYRNGGVRYLARWSWEQVQDWRNWRQLKSQFGTRVALLIVANLGNWALMLFGLIERPRDYDTYLLGVVLLNLVLYVIFYLVMKTGYGEHLGREVKLTLVVLVVVWVTAVQVFFLRSTDWSDTPAKSRDLNQACILFNFYDWHDVWHFLSALALFTSYYLIMIIDDDLAYTPRDMIAVF